jgi:hypothetical protein
VNEDQEWAAVRLVAPHLGTPLDAVRKVRPQNDKEFPGLTFDFAARRRDGSRLAVEVTSAWDARWISAQATMTRLAAMLTAKLVPAGCRPGHYGLSVIGEENVPAIHSVDLDALASAASTLATGNEVKVGHAFRVHNWGGTIDHPVAFGSVTSAEFMEGPQSQARFRYAVADCTPKLVRAGHIGLETHLVIVHWMLGSTTSFKLALDSLTIGEHPHGIWVVDLGGWPNREPTERLR